ncbi:MAG: methionyl-tRNA formyltransferase, partial [Armatimonadetes bacterium]|nr:methionyl-tRNA formyltransferase [Armatimonadota bacterium]
PDRPRGRSGEPQPSPVKARAVELGLEVYQPERLRGNAEAVAWLAREPADVGVVVAFGQILPPEVLALPGLGCINVHFSLLPRYRGAAPVHWAVLNGETETGVMTMHMDAGLDTGDILLTERVQIGDNETAGELTARLAALAPTVLLRTLEEWSAGRLTPIPQDPVLATYAPRLEREHGRVDWKRAAREVVNQIRGVTPQPGAVATVRGEELKIWRATLGEGAGEPGEVLAIDGERGLLVAAGDGAVWLTEVQSPGRQRVGGAEFARGKHWRV